MTDKLISHERAKRSVQNLYDPSNGSEKYCLELVEYILQQEKVTKLLGLYQKKSELLVQIASGKYLQDDYMKLLEKIDNLEKELGKMT